MDGWSEVGGRRGVTPAARKIALSWQDMGATPVDERSEVGGRRGVTPAAWISAAPIS